MSFSSSIRICFYTILQLDERFPSTDLRAVGAANSLEENPLPPNLPVTHGSRRPLALSLPGLIAQALIVDWLYWRLAPER